MAVIINPEEVRARREELQSLLADTALQDALSKVRITNLASSSGLTKDEFLKLMDSYKTFSEMIDTLISQSIVLLNDTETYFVAVDKRLAQEFGDG